LELAARDKLRYETEMADWNERGRKQMPKRPAYAFNFFNQHYFKT